jgi:hypothetical protein
MSTTTTTTIRRMVRRALAELPAGDLLRLRADAAPAPVPANPFGEAAAHIRSAHRILAALPSRLHDEAGHDDGVRTMHAHLHAAVAYLDHYRDCVIPPAVSNPEGEVAPSPAAERARAHASAVLAGFGKTTQTRRH